jgi:hypothetical protein
MAVSIRLPSFFIFLKRISIEPNLDSLLNQKSMFIGNNFSGPKLRLNIPIRYLEIKGYQE